MLHTTHTIEITPQQVTLDGQLLPTTQSGDTLLVELYRAHVGDYPKFFKMDTLSRLAFVASELVLQKETVKKDRKVIFANRSASIKNDTDYLKTITGESYFPSPALFVYTLPNICTGEIAIRNHYHEETCFYVLESEDQLNELAETIPMEAGLIGWVECSEKDRFYAKVRTVDVKQ